MKLKEYIEVQGMIVLKEGLRVGGTKEAVGIGETDNPIIRHPITRKPYIPGSSIKGKVRSLLEQKYSENSQRTGRPCDCGSCFICSLFGCGNPSKGTNPQGSSSVMQIWLVKAKKSLKTPSRGPLSKLKRKLPWIVTKGERYRVPPAAGADPRRSKI